MPVSPRPALTLLSNLRPANRSTRRSPMFLPALVVLLVLRALLHHTFSTQFAEAVPWSIGEALLAVHVSYGPLIQNLLKKFNPVSKPTTAGAIKALAHITGGGFVDNIPRVLPAKCDAVVLKGSWEMPPIFQIIREKGGVDEAELYQVFNMGIGMTVVVDADRADAVLRAIKAAKHPAWILGQITKGSGVCRVE